MTVAFADERPNGLADLVGRLIEANLERRPERLRLLRGSDVELRASDVELVATIRLSPGRVVMVNGSTSHRPHLRVEARAAHLLELASVPLRFGLPDALDARGRAVLRRIAGRDVRVSGMLRHPLRLSRFTRLLSVEP